MAHASSLPSHPVIQPGINDEKRGKKDQILYKLVAGKGAFMAASRVLQRPMHLSRRTYYLLRDGSVSKSPSPSHLLRIRAESLSMATLMALALEAKLRADGIYLAFEAV